MVTGFSIVQISNSSKGEYTLYQLLVKLDKFYIPPISSKSNLEQYSKKLLKNSKVFSIVNTKGEYVGLLAIYVNDIVNRVAFISSLGILPEYHGSGLSSDLINRAFVVAVENGMRSISLEVDFCNQKAIKYYKKHGFIKSKIVKANTLLMTKELDIKESFQPFVSISCITYNHANFIRETINGFLMQKTTFPIEILIHDDASTDGTVEIIREYEKKHPDLIFPIYQTVNQYSQGIKISSTHQFPRARGKYIALCEGDDFWTDPLKLQKQVDFLETNAEYILCFHKVKALVDNKLQEDEVLEKRHQKIIDKNSLTTFDLLKHGNFIHTCSVVFRNNPIKFPFEYDYSPVGDYFLFILLSETGLLYRIDDYMGVYRRNSGVYSTLSPLDMQRKIVQYHIAILSYLSDCKQRNLFLQKTFIAFENFEKMLTSQAYQKEKIAENIGWKEIIKILSHKIRQKIHNQ